MQGSQTEKVSQTSHLFALLFTSFLPQIFPLFSCRGYFFVYSSLLQNSQKLMLLGFLEGFFFWFLFKFVKRKRLTENVCFVLYFSAFGFSISFKLRTFETICQQQAPTHAFFFNSRMHSAAWQRFMQAFHKADNMAYD